MRIDIFNHIFPKTFFDKMIEVAPNQKDIGKRVRAVPAIVDLDVRFRVMDQFEDLKNSPSPISIGRKSSKEMRDDC